MRIEKLLIVNESGLHARPAALFSQTAQQYRSQLTLHHNGRTGDAKNLLNILGLSISQGSEVLLEADGPDADAAIEALKELVDAGFEVLRFEAREDTDPNI